MLIKRQTAPDKNRKIRIALCAIFVILLFVIPTTRKIIRSSVVVITTPIVYKTHAVGDWMYAMIETLRFKYSLVDENKSLTNQIANLQARFSNYDEVVRENQDLKLILGRSTGTQFTLAAVLSKPPTSIYDTLVIDGGASVGMQIGQTVYVNGDMPIGTISSLFSKTAVVELYSSSSEKMDARLDPAHIDVTLFGHGGGDYLVSVPHDLIVPENSVVVSKEINPHVLGTLEKVISDARDSSQTLIFSSPVNINQLSFVEVAQ